MLKFAPNISSPDITFWKKLAELKLEEYKLNKEPKPIEGIIEITSYDNLSPRISLDETSFSNESQIVKTQWRIPGILYDTSTLDEFKNLNRNKIITDASNRLTQCIIEYETDKNKNLIHLNYFILCTYGDLKTHEFTYWFAFPSLLPKKPFMGTILNETSISSLQLASKEFINDQLNIKKESNILKDNILLNEDENKLPLFFFIIIESNKRPTLYSFSNWNKYKSEILNLLIEKRIQFGYVDISTFKKYPGWSIRNYLMFLIFILKDIISNHNNMNELLTLQIVCFRESLHSIKDNKILLKRSIMFETSLFDEISNINLSKNPFEKTVKILGGWELNTLNKSEPRKIDLSQFLNPYHLAHASAELNLKLMRWRQMPELNLEFISTQKCLILGAGTLGCNIGRNLLAWGIRHITFVDHSKVSFSNPVRQSLYEYEDCLNGGKDKAKAAADALKRILPMVHTQGYSISIPMPGHMLGINDNMEIINKMENDFNQLKDLIQQSDIIFLGTDTRESRWLPTLLVATENKQNNNKILINVALGFDSYLIMHHGFNTINTIENTKKIGCYFCNDIVAPDNSLKNRTMDQMCTVTRPGLAPIAAALSVELLIEILQINSINNKNNNNTIKTSIPHQIRGFIPDFKIILPYGEKFYQCTACSNYVINEYLKSSFSFILKVCSSPFYLEEITGLLDLRKEMENVNIEAFNGDFEDENDHEIYMIT